MEDHIIDRIREFNRFYTTLIGALNKNFLGSDYSLTETRILFELNLNSNCKANDLVHSLHIDKSYMSRLIKSFEKKGLIEKQGASDDKRANIIILTEHGKEVIDLLIAATNQQIKGLVSSLTAEECHSVICAMDTITQHFNTNNIEE